MLILSNLNICSLKKLKQVKFLNILLNTTNGSGHFNLISPIGLSWILYVCVLGGQGLRFHINIVIKQKLKYWRQETLQLSSMIILYLNLRSLVKRVQWPFLVSVSDFNIDSRSVSAGYGHIVPVTPIGKIVTILYAVIGVPLFLLYLSNIGQIFATSFKWTYSRLCKCQILHRRRSVSNIQSNTIKTTLFLSVCPPFLSVRHTPSK